ncbi:hypothetical protein D3C72_2209630 [compost metagenome]
MTSSSSQTVWPTARRMASAVFFCSSLTPLLATMPVMPMPIRAGEFGMQRTIAG